MHTHSMCTAAEFLFCTASFGVSVDKTESALMNLYVCVAAAMPSVNWPALCYKTAKLYTNYLMAAVYHRGGTICQGRSSSSELLDKGIV